VTPPFSRWKTVGAIGWGSLSVVAAQSSDSSDLSEHLLPLLAAGKQSLIVIGINRGQRSVLDMYTYAVRTALTFTPANLCDKYVK
jgi:hypothetical protein